MRKLLIFIFLIISCFGLSGCNKIYNLASKNIAEIRHNVFEGESDNFKITFMSGKREKDYVINGYNTPLIEFGVVTITLKTEIKDISQSHFALTIDTLRYEEILEQNPFDGTLVADIGVSINQQLPSMIIKLFVGEISEEITLNNMCVNWKVDSDKALKIACKNLKSELSPLSNNDFQGEVYIKIIEDTISNENTHLWYVNFVSRNGIHHSIIIHPMTSKILAKK